MDLSYNYDRLASKGSLNGKTGNLTHIVDNLDRNKDRKYEYDTLGRLTKSLGGASAGGTGATANWTQNYTYDRYGNKKATTKSGITANSQAVPLDGLASQAYAATTNRITTSGHEYDHAGNMTRGKAPDGTLQRFEYDAAGRLVKIKTDAGALLEEYLYGADRQRIKKTVANGDKTYYAWGGSSVIAEYTEAAAATTMTWAKSYVYAGSRLLSTITKNGASETTEYHHPDRLGTKLVTNTSTNTAKSQATLPFGTAISSETTATTNQKFTSYDRSGATGLDYAVNRTYNSGQSRFTQVDPIGMASASIGNPQSLNLFAYTQNDPIGYTDPSGLNLSSGFGTTCYLDGMEVSCSLVYQALAGGWGEPAGGGGGFLGYWEDFDDLSNPDPDGFPGTGTRFVPNSLYLNGLLDDPDDYQLIPSGLIDDIKDIIEEEILTDKCQRAWNNVLATAIDATEAVSNNPLVVLGEVIQQGGVRNRGLGGRASSARNSIGTGDAFILLAGKFVDAAINGGERDVRVLAGLVLAEVYHHSGRSALSDEVLARAANEIGLGKKIKGRPTEGWSNYFHNAINKKCEVTKPKN